MRHITLSKRSREKMLHIEAPGCIINIQIGLHHDGHEVTRVDVLADGDRYSGEPYPNMPYETDEDEEAYWRAIEDNQASNPEWWARGDIKRTGAVVLVESEE